MHATTTSPIPPEQAALMPPPPRPLAVVATLVAALLALVALGGMTLGFVAVANGVRTRAVLFLIVFAVPMLAAALLAVLAGRRRFRSGPAMTLLIAAGTAIVGALLTEHLFVLRLMGRNPAVTPIMGVSLVPLAMTQVLLGMLLAALAALVVMARRPMASVTRLSQGVLVLLPALALAACFAIGRIRTPLLDGLERAAAGVVGSAAPTLVGVLLVIVFTIAGVALAVGIHLVIRALEIGGEPAAGPGPAPAKAASAD